MATREEILLKTVKKSDLIIEIGPSYNPLTPKANGWNSKSIDHATREELVEKYLNDPNVNVNKIEEVNFVWRKGLLSDAVPVELHGQFDCFIASHVIEHVPDILGFLDSAKTLLSDSGTVVLAIPDKRYCFDYFRPLASTWDVIAAHNEKRVRHAPGSLFDHMAYSSFSSGVGAWGQTPVSNFSFINTLEEAYALASTANMDPDSPYHDVHAWPFIPATFQLTMLELARLGKTDWDIHEISAANGCEFYVWLKRGGAERAANMSAQAFNARRLFLQRQILVELQEQINFHLSQAPSSPIQPVIQAHSSTESTNTEYVDWFPRVGNAVKIYEGEWSSALPGFPSGAARLFEDGRIDWFEEKLGSFSGQHVLELGPLEGGHSMMLSQRGAKILSIEGNKRAYQRCLLVKDLYGLTNVNFLLGDFTQYLDNHPPRFDFVLASGVLYHMLDPINTLKGIMRAGNNIGIWTHYYDHDVIQAREDLKIKFSGKPTLARVKFGRRKIQLYEQYYLNALEWKGFCGGSKATSVWMTRDGILEMLEGEGFRCEIGMDHKDHPNGPAFCVFAKRVN